METNGNNSLGVVEGSRVQLQLSLADDHGATGSTKGLRYETLGGTAGRLSERAVASRVTGGHAAPEDGSLPSKGSSELRR